MLGDIGLYGLGKLAAMFPWAHRLDPAAAGPQGQRWLQQRVFKVVFIARFLPGVRLPTYTACGFLGAGFQPVPLAAVGRHADLDLGAVHGLAACRPACCMEYFGAWRWVGAIGFVIFIIAAGRIALPSCRTPDDVSDDIR